MTATAPIAMPTPQPMPSSPPPASSIELSEATDPARFGHKAAALARLLGHGFEVPDGFVVPVGGEPTLSEIEEALARIGDGAVAVRSTGIAEDRSDASFAGQYDTVLGVEGAAAVQEAIAKVQDSARQAEARGYGASTGGMAVLVQCMVEPRAAGVAFSANPMTGDRGQVVLSAAAGLANRLVAGLADGDGWVVDAEGPRRTTSGDQVLEGTEATRVAELARQIEAFSGAPQDIEWAIDEEGTLRLLQARPITVLPVEPERDVPEGTWMKDASHYPLPVTPLGATTHLVDVGQFEPMFETWGLLPDNVAVRTIGHELYLQILPDDGGADPPPWWLLAVVARVIPSLRRKLKRARNAIESGLLDELPRRWNEEQRPDFETRIRDFAHRDLTSLSDEALFDHLGEIVDLSAEGLRLHLLLNMPHVVGCRELCVVCEEALGWKSTTTFELLQGLSPASATATKELAAIVDALADNAAARQVVARRSDRLVDELDAVAPDAAAALRAYLKVWGLRIYGREVGQPSVAECRDLFAEMMADLLEDGAHVDRRDAGRKRIDEARAAIADPELRRRFDEALAYAELTYPLREDNVVLLDELPVGLLRGAALEAGRRLVERGHLSLATDAVMLTRDELVAAVVDGATEDLRTIVQRRHGEHAWVRAHPGPATYGPASDKLPDLRGFPEPARRLNGALLWELEQEVKATAPERDDVMAGLAASPGTYRGRVRVITDPRHLAAVRPGEVLVCPETSAAWMMVFRRAGALVTDHGSPLSHTAIVAREFGLPAVVATGHGTRTLRTGEEVIVDGNEGTVTRV